MPRIALHKHARLLVGSSLAIVLLAGGVAFAVGAIPGADGVIHGCYNTNNGILRVIDPTASSCNNSESAIFWNQEGVPGADGTDGTNGIDGTNGTNGIDGTNGVNGQNGLDGKTVLNGTAAPDSTVGTLGDFYLDTTSSTLYGPKSATGWGTGISLVGPQGPQGSQGPQGATGATGPAGSAGNVTPHVRVGQDVSNDSLATVRCNTGEAATGGGFIYGLGPDRIVQSVPIDGAGALAVHGTIPVGWRVVSSGGTGVLKAYVVCVPATDA